MKYGGNLADYPEPRRRKFDDRRRRRSVSASISTWIGTSAIGAIHWYVKFTIESNPLWDESDQSWVQCWDDIDHSRETVTIEDLNVLDVIAKADRYIEKNFPRSHFKAVRWENRDYYENRYKR